jgi:Fe-S-cluster containining protein
MLKVIGECNRCMKCCICWYYDIPNQPAEIPPRLGWCLHLNLETKECKVEDNKPEGCRNYPTMRDFEMGAVPKECGFTDGIEKLL